MLNFIRNLIVIGDTKDVHPGLYVMDGAIIPTSVGVNPIMTIAMLAERCCRLMIEDGGWKVDYNSFKDLSMLCTSDVNVDTNLLYSGSNINSLDDWLLTVELICLIS